MLAGSQAAYRAALERAGVILVDNIEALMETACFFAKVTPPQARGIAVLASSGGAAIMAADKADQYGIPLPQPGEDAQKVLNEKIPEFGSTRNPFDVTAQVMNLPDVIPACANALADDPRYAAVVVPTVYASPALGRPAADLLRRRRAHRQADHLGVGDRLAGRPRLGQHRGQPADDAVPLDGPHLRHHRRLAALGRRCAPRRPARWSAAPPPPPPPRPPASSPRPPPASLTEREAKSVLSHYGIPVVEERLADSADAAVAAARGLGLPVVLKAESPDLPHKTEAGVIRLNLKTPDEVRAAYAEIIDNAARVSPPPRLNGVLVQPMVPAGTEVMIGARIDPQFGPLVVIGLGGILVELLKDTAVALAPVTHAEALAMLGRLKAGAILRGFRGSPPVDLDALADIIGRVSEFIADQRDAVSELDLNPLICIGKRLIAVDALIVRRG